MCARSSASSGDGSATCWTRGICRTVGSEMATGRRRWTEDEVEAVVEGYRSVVEGDG